MAKVNMKNFKGGPNNVFNLAIGLFATLLLLMWLTDSFHSNAPISYSDFEKSVKAGQVDSVKLVGSDLHGLYKNKPGQFHTRVPSNDPKIWDVLRENNVNVSLESPSDFSFWNIIFLVSVIATLFMVWFMFKQSRNTNGSSGLFSMTSSKEKMYLPSEIKYNFDSVAGAAEAKEELKDVVDFLRNPEKYRKIGARLTKGVLLIGQPGNGKTLLAKAVAGEANCPFFSISGSDFIEVFVGVGASRVRSLFKKARQHAPCIVFIDEIDAVGRQRAVGLGGGNDEREQTLNQLLTEMDGFDTGKDSIVVIGATNRVDVLDKALLRPGRFDKQVEVPYPDLKSREEILKVHAKGVKIDPSVDMNKIARGTPGFTGADLENLINEAAINASKHNQSFVTVNDFEEARDKVTIGKERKTIVLTEHDRRTTAYHEAGHAMLILLKPNSIDVLHKVTITPRGHALGVTHRLPEREQYTKSKEDILSSVMVALGGRAAEELVFNSLETGAYSDFTKATEMVRNMVCLFGMSDKLGMVVYKQGQGDYVYSQETAKLIDDEVRNIIANCYQETISLLTKHRDMLNKLAEELLIKETLYAGEIYTLLGIAPREEHLFS